MSKTLIGKNGYLFLINDACDEINTHQNNVCKLSADFYKKYTFNNILLVVFPNKSLTCKQYLPDGYDLQYRPAFNKYADYLKNNMFRFVKLNKLGVADSLKPFYHTFKIGKINVI